MCKADCNLIISFKCNFKIQLVMKVLNNYDLFIYMIGHSGNLGLLIVVRHSIAYEVRGKLNDAGGSPVYCCVCDVRN